MKVAIITNIRAPYRILQFNEFAKIKKIKLTVYYTHKEEDNRKWEIKKNIGFSEVYLKGWKISNKYGYFNKNLIELVKQNDVIVIGGYEQPTYIVISLLCKLFNKVNVLLYDGISTDRIYSHENFAKKFIKKLVINNTNYILGNGKVSRLYFEKNFNYKSDKIFNQFLTVDGNTIKSLYIHKNEYKKYYRDKYQLKVDDKVLMYSGRLVDIKNLKSVILAISKMKLKNIVLFIAGDGPLKDILLNEAQNSGVRCIITGFITEQMELFKHYFLADVFILPSICEPWGLVVNEAMFSGLPVIVSKVCGSSLDLVYEGKNGYTVDPYNVEDIKNKLDMIFGVDKIDKMGCESTKIIEKWTFYNSKKQLEYLLNDVKKKYDNI